MDWRAGAKRAPDSEVILFRIPEHTHGHVGCHIAAFPLHSPSLVWCLWSNCNEGVCVVSTTKDCYSNCIKTEGWRTVVSQALTLQKENASKKRLDFSGFSEMNRFPFLFFNAFAIFFFLKTLLKNNLEKIWLDLHYIIRYLRVQT